ncbi:MAG: hypothetical protein KIS66_14100 [Fimbriimonadaceae bacterium]|nr:hypothetical protein [Fimbriimonadaceae bacterium]
MIATFTALILLASPQTAPLKCAVMHEAADLKIAKVDFNGARFSFCCGGCDGTFQKSPEKYLTKESLKGDVVGEFLFDPVSGKRIAAKDAKAQADFGGLRYYFESAANKASFEQHKAAFGAMPKKEALYCAVMGHAVKDYASAGGFVDHEGTRYYVCCADCLAAMKKEPGKFVAKAADQVKPPKAVSSPKEG